MCRVFRVRVLPILCVRCGEEMWCKDMKVMVCPRCGYEMRFDYNVCSGDEV